MIPPVSEVLVLSTEPGLPTKQACEQLLHRVHMVDISDSHHVCNVATGVSHSTKDKLLDPLYLSHHVPMSPIYSFPWVVAKQNPLPLYESHCSRCGGDDDGRKKALSSGVNSTGAVHAHVETRIDLPNSEDDHKIRVDIEQLCSGTIRSLYSPEGTACIIYSNTDSGQCAGVHQTSQNEETLFFVQTLGDYSRWYTWSRKTFTSLKFHCKCFGSSSREYLLYLPLSITIVSRYRDLELAPKILDRLVSGDFSVLWNFCLGKTLAMRSHTELWRGCWSDNLFQSSPTGICLRDNELGVTLHDISVVRTGGESNRPVRTQFPAYSALSTVDKFPLTRNAKFSLLMKMVNNSSNWVYGLHGDIVRMVGFCSFTPLVIYPPISSFHLRACELKENVRDTGGPSKVDQIMDYSYTQRVLSRRCRLDLSFDFRYLVDIVSTRNIMWCLKRILLEQKLLIVFGPETPQMVCVAVIEALLELIYPFGFHHVYVPFALPDSLDCLIQCSSPVLAGCQLNLAELDSPDETSIHHLLYTRLKGRTRAGGLEFKMPQISLTEHRGGISGMDTEELTSISTVPSEEETRSRTPIRSSTETRFCEDQMASDYYCSDDDTKDDLRKRKCDQSSSSSTSEPCYSPAGYNLPSPDEGHEKPVVFQQRRHRGFLGFFRSSAGGKNRITDNGTRNVTGIDPIEPQSLGSPGSSNSNTVRPSFGSEASCLSEDQHVSKKLDTINILFLPQNVRVNAKRRIDASETDFSALPPFPGRMESIMSKALKKVSVPAAKKNSLQSRLQLRAGFLFAFAVTFKEYIDFVSNSEQEDGICLDYKAFIDTFGNRDKRFLGSFLDPNNIQVFDQFLVNMHGKPEAAIWHSSIRIVRESTTVLRIRRSSNSLHLLATELNSPVEFKERGRRNASPGDDSPVMEIPREFGSPSSKRSFERDCKPIRKITIQLGHTPQDKIYDDILKSVYATVFIIIPPSFTEKNKFYGNYNRTPHFNPNGDQGLHQWMCEIQELISLIKHNDCSQHTVGDLTRRVIDSSNHGTRLYNHWSSSPGTHQELNDDVLPPTSGGSITLKNEETEARLSLSPRNSDHSNHKEGKYSQPSMVTIDESFFTYVKMGRRSVTATSCYQLILLLAFPLLSAHRLPNHCIWKILRRETDFFIGTSINFDFLDSIRSEVTSGDRYEKMATDTNNAVLTMYHQAAQRESTEHLCQQYSSHRSSTDCCASGHKIFSLQCYDIDSSNNEEPCNLWEVMLDTWFSSLGDNYRSSKNNSCHARHSLSVCRGGNSLKKTIEFITIENMFQMVTESCVHDFNLWGNIDMMMNLTLLPGPMAQTITLYDILLGYVSICEENRKSGILEKDLPNKTIKPNQPLATRKIVIDLFPGDSR